MEKIVALFPGQGSQFIGMGKTLYNEFAVAKETFEEASDTLKFDMTDLCFEGSLLNLNKTENMLLSILTVSVAAFRVYMKEIGIKPMFAAGHSLGEYSALTCAGAISFQDALKLVRKRGSLAQQIADSGIGAMTVVNGVNYDTVERACNDCSINQEIVSIACYNSFNQFVISGHKEAIIKAEDMIIAMGGQVTPLLVSAPFHCSLMQPAAEGLKEELKKYNYNRFDFPVISNVSALPYFDSKDIIDNLTLQLTQTVKWQSTMDYICNQGITRIIEMGPQSVLTNLAEAHTKKMVANSFGQKDDRDSLLKVLNKYLHNKVNIYLGSTIVTKCLAMAVCTRNSNFDEQKFQTGVIEPYENIQSIQDRLEREGKYPTTSEAKESLEMLKVIFDTKKVPIKEQAKRFRRVFSESGTIGVLRELEMKYSI